MKSRVFSAGCLALVALAGCEDPFVEGEDFECSDARDIVCERGYVCVDNWCEKACEYARECAGNEACIRSYCQTYTSACDPGDAEPCVEGWFCADDVCRKYLEIGQGCEGESDCGGRSCVDDVCCETACDGVCMACIEEATGTADGTCAVVLSGEDPRDDCYDSLACDGEGACAEGQVGDGCTGSGQCALSFCVDGVCCESACTGLCMACDTGRTGADDGRCEPVTSGIDPDEECTDILVCDGTGDCLIREVGDPCEEAIQCSNNRCVDGVCCATDCDALCAACSEALNGVANGNCSPVAANTDPDDDCAGATACNAAGVCWSTILGQGCGADYECGSGHCVDLVCCDDACDAPCWACVESVTGVGDGACEEILDGTDHPDEHCPGNTACDGTGYCYDNSDGAGCAHDYECQSGFCTDGVCCDAACEGLCMACDGSDTVAAAAGACSPMASGLDPDDECAEHLACRPVDAVSGSCWGRSDFETCAEDYECLNDYCCAEHCEPQWQQYVTSPTSEDLNDVWGDALDNLWAVGANRTVIQYDGAQWGLYSGTVNLAAGTDLLAVHGSGSVVMVVGTSRSIATLIPGAFVPMAFDANVPGIGINDIWVVSSNEAYAVGDDGYVIEWDGAEWSLMYDAASRPTTVSLESVWVSEEPQKTIYAVGYSQSLTCHPGCTLGPPESDVIRGVYSDSTWSWSNLGFASDIPEAALFSVVYFDGRVWAASGTPVGSMMCRGGAVYVFDGVDTWARENTAPIMTSLWPGTSQLFGGYSCGLEPGLTYKLLSRYDPASGTKTTWNNSSFTDALWGTSDCDVFTVGGDGVILRR